VIKFLRAGVVLPGVLLGVFAFTGTASAGNIGLVPNGGCLTYDSSEGTVYFCDRDLRSAGTGVIDPFLRVGKDGDQQDGTPGTYSSGWNTDATKQAVNDPTNDFDFSWSSALDVSDIGFGTPPGGSGSYAIFTTDINQKKNDERYLSLNQFELFNCTTNNYTSLGSCTSFFDLFATGDWITFDYSNHTGSGAGDIDIYLPSTIGFGTDYVALLDGWGCGVPGLTCNALPGTPGAATALFSDNDGFQEWLRTGDAVETTTTEIVDTTTGNIPEPTLLTLLGVGLAAASRRFRRRTA
jgi:hypothetical protein